MGVRQAIERIRRRGTEPLTDLAGASGGLEAKSREAKSRLSLLTPVI